MNKKSPFEDQTSVKDIDFILLVGSGKGGVGKSTVALNLASSLSCLNWSVGVLDGDIYGPSLPRLTGTLRQRPELGENNKIVPLRRFGLNLMSMGYLVDEDSPLVWRGPMLFKAINQLFHDVSWGKLDALVVDLPPGTGDVALTIAQKISVSGGIVVTTPQNLSLTDTRKAVSMFETLKIPLTGVVENMSYMEMPDGEKQDLFPKGQLDVFLKSKKIQKLTSIPFHPHIGLSCESGVPLTESYPDSKEGLAFSELAIKVKQFLLSSRKNTPIRFEN